MSQFAGELNEKIQQFEYVISRRNLDSWNATLESDQMFDKEVFIFSDLHRCISVEGIKLFNEEEAFSVSKSQQLMLYLQYIS